MKEADLEGQEEAQEDTINALRTQITILSLSLKNATTNITAAGEANSLLREELEIQRLSRAETIRELRKKILRLEESHRKQHEENEYLKKSLAGTKTDLEKEKQKVATVEGSLPEHCANMMNSRDCSIFSFTAFQIGSLTLLVFSYIFYLIDFLSTHSSESNYRNLMQFWTVFMFLAVSYTISEWLIEENHFFTLRELASRFKFPYAKVQFNSGIIPKFELKRLNICIPLYWAEFIIRVSIVLLLALAVVKIPEAISKSHSDFYLGYVFLCFVPVLLLTWDVLLIVGGQWRLVKPLFKSDIVGLILAVLCFVSQSNQNTELFIIIIWGVYAGWYAKKLSGDPSLKLSRLFNREQLR